MFSLSPPSLEGHGLSFGPQGVAAEGELHQNANPKRALLLEKPSPERVQRQRELPLKEIRVS